jgi:PAS domain-containing protein
VNQKAAEIFGRSPRDLIGKNIWAEFPEGIGQPFDLAYRKAMADQKFTTIEAYYPPWNRWFENRIHPSPDGLAIFFQDITDRRATARERARLATIVETTPDAVIMSDAEGALLYFNHAERRRRPREHAPGWAARAERAGADLGYCHADCAPHRSVAR